MPGGEASPRPANPQPGTLSEAGAVSMPMATPPSAAVTSTCATINLRLSYSAARRALQVRNKGRERRSDSVRGTPDQVRSRCRFDQHGASCRSKAPAKTMPYHGATNDSRGYETHQHISLPTIFRRNVGNPHQSIRPTELCRPELGKYETGINWSQRFPSRCHRSASDAGSDRSSLMRSAQQPAGSAASIALPSRWPGPPWSTSCA